ncbi:AAA family ATPase [Apibacter raozihei]|uniref:phosphatase domain-containing protein n=1 Tax=Apibacter raozihei TaxID=2500547 RepID=UPI000FE2C2CE|nr:AAA family ATPase [Apibacter raozihei]
MKKNIQILLLIGPPGSGKSTFAKYFLRTEENWMRVCRDDFRHMNFSQENLSGEKEHLITKLVDASIQELIKKKTNVLIDATHCKKEYITEYIKKFNSYADISFKLFDLSLEELRKRCINREEQTGKHIPVRVLERMFEQFQNLKQNFDFSTRPKILTQPANADKVQDMNLPKALICDLDGTLALMKGRNPFDAGKSNEDELNLPVGNVLKNYFKLGYKILLVSGREEKHREPTLEFLEKYEIPYDNLWMRKSDDYRKDSIVKTEIYKEYIENQYYIEFILDDRNQVVDMWRKELKLSCFQVNYGDF